MSERIQNERRVDYILIVLVFAFWMAMGLESCSSATGSEKAETTSTVFKIW